MTTKGGGEEISKLEKKQRCPSFSPILILTSPPPRSVKATLFFLLLTRPRRGQSEREQHTLTLLRYKSSPSYRGQHTDKCVSTPHPTDPSLKTSETYGGRCGAVSVWNWQIDAPIHSRLPYVSRTRVELDVLGMIIEKGFGDMSCVCVCEVSCTFWESSTCS